MLNNWLAKGRVTKKNKLIVKGIYQHWWIQHQMLIIRIFGYTSLVSKGPKYGGPNHGGALKGYSTWTLEAHEVHKEHLQPISPIGPVGSTSRCNYFLERHHGPLYLVWGGKGPQNVHPFHYKGGYRRLWHKIILKVNVRLFWKW